MIQNKKNFKTIIYNIMLLHDVSKSFFAGQSASRCKIVPLLKLRVWHGLWHDAPESPRDRREFSYELKSRECAFFWLPMVGMYVSLPFLEKL